MTGRPCVGGLGVGKSIDQEKRSQLTILLPPPLVAAGEAPAYIVGGGPAEALR